MFRIFEPKEIKTFRAGLNKLEKRLCSSSSFNRVRKVIEADLKVSTKEYIVAINNTKDAELIAANSVGNVSGDFVESGQLHIYRGVLSPAGEAMLDLYIRTIKFSADRGDLREGFFEENLEAIKSNIQSTG